MIIKHKGEFLHRPPKTYGDCYRTAIACILGLERNDVPHFLHDGDEEAFDRRIGAWLAENRLCMSSVAYDGGEHESPERFLDGTKRFIRNTTFLFSGTSSLGSNHTVVAGDGAILWDPSPEDSGIVGPMDDGHYWIDFILPDYARI